MFAFSVHGAILSSFYSSAELIWVTTASGMMESIFSRNAKAASQRVWTTTFSQQFDKDGNAVHD
jgi:hypothetical protein